MLVIYKTEKHTAFITLNSPGTGNTINRENLDLITHYIRLAVHDGDIRAIVLTGKGGVFCRGMDFGMVFGENDTEKFTKPYMETILAIRNAPKPIISLVDGEVLAGGMGLVCASDIVICTDTSSFGLSEVYFGLIPAYVFPLLLERIPFKKARYLAISSTRINAAEAHTIGLADEVVPQSGLMKKVREYLQRILFSSPDAIGLVKRYSDSLLERELHAALVKAGEQLEALLRNEQNRKAIRAFRNGETLPWSINYRKSR